MATLKLKDIVDHNFQLALKKLLEAEIPATTAWTLVQLSKKVNEYIKSYDEVRMTTLKKFAKLENDNLMVDENGSVQFLDDKAKETAIAELDALLSEEVEVSTFKVSQMADVKVEARLLLILEKVITN